WSGGFLASSATLQGRLLQVYNKDCFLFVRHRVFLARVADSRVGSITGQSRSDWGVMMRWSMFAGAGLLSVLTVSGSVFAAEIPVQARPKAAPARAPARPVAQAQPTSNWSGSQVGGFNGASNMSNAMVEPGAFLYFAFPSSSNVETPFSV